MKPSPGHGLIAPGPLGALALIGLLAAPARAARELPIDEGVPPRAAAAGRSAVADASNPRPVEVQNPLNAWTENGGRLPSYRELLRLGELFQEQPLDAAASVIASAGISSPQVEYTLALSYEAQDRPEEALRHFQRVLPTGRVKLEVEAAAGAARMVARLRALREAPVRCPKGRSALFAIEDEEGRIHVDRPPLLLVHGYGGSGSDLHAVALRFRRLGRQVFVACYDSRRKTVRDSGHELARMVTSMHAHGVGGELTVLAHSMGGLVARMALNELTLTPRRPLEAWRRVRLIAVDSPWHGYIGPADEGAEAQFFRAISPLLPRGMWQMRARSALFLGNPRSPDPVERAGLFGVELPEHVTVELAFARHADDGVMSYHDGVLRELPERLLHFYTRDLPVRGDPRIENFWHALQSATAYGAFTRTLRDAADDGTLDAATVERALEWYFPVFPGDHSSVLQEQPGGTGLLDHLVSGVVDPEREPS